MHFFFYTFLKTVDFKFGEQSLLINPVFINSNVYGVVKFVFDMSTIKLEEKTFDSVYSIWSQLSCTRLTLFFAQGDT